MPELKRSHLVTAFSIRLPNIGIVQQCLGQSFETLSQLPVARLDPYAHSSMPTARDNG